VQALRYIAVLAVAAILVSAAEAAPGQPKKKIIPAVQAKAKAINVQLSDLPKAGWTAKPSSPDTSNPRCSYYNPDQSDLTENGDINSPEFTLPSSSYISSTTGIFRSAAQGRTAYARVVQPALPKCLAQIFRKGAGQAKVKIVSSAAVPFPRVADRSNAFRIVADFRQGTQTIHVYIDLAVMNRGKVDVALFFVGINFVFNAKFEHSLAARIAARMATA
jgi:hypothetical protein